MNNTRQLKLGALFAYLSIGINIATGLLYTPWMIRSIGKSDYGLYTLAMSVISLFVFDFGLSSAVTRFISKYKAEGDEKKIKLFMGTVYSLYLGIAIALFIFFTCFYFFIPYIYRELSPLEIEKFKVVYAIASIFAVVSFPCIPQNGILTANEKFIQLKGCDIINKLSVVCLMSVCLFMGFGLYALVTVNAICGLLTIFLKYYFIYHSTSTRALFHRISKHELMTIFSYSGWVTLIALASRMIFNIMPTILGIFAGAGDIAVFGVASILEGFVFTFANAINGMFLPRVSRIVATPEGNVLPLMVKVGRIQIYITSLIIFGFIVCGKDFLTLWIGKDFDAVYAATILLMLPSLFHLPQEIADQTVLAVNRVKEKAYIFLVMGGLNILLAILLVQRWGIIGIATSIFIAYVVRTIGLDILYYRVLHIYIYSFFRQSYAKILPWLAFPLSIGIAFHYMFHLSGWTGLFTEGFVFVIVYIITMYYVTDESEKKLFFRFNLK